MRDKTIDKLDEMLWILRYGRPKRKISPQMVLSRLDRIEKPVFFLSTGRCGTKWFAEVLDLSKEVKSNHEPIPTFSMQSAYLFQMWNNSAIPTEEKVEITKNIFTAGREQHLRYAYKCEKRYIETNNQLTFFAPGLAEMFPDAQFVHLYRHPGEVVRSGMRRGWFADNESATAKIIRPRPDSGVPWESYSQIQKIAWVWKTTNAFIEEFLKGIDQHRKLSFDFNTKSLISVKGMVDFLGLDIPEHQISKKLNVRVNRQTTGKVLKYEEWEDARKEELREICGEMAGQYGYSV